MVYGMFGELLPLNSSLYLFPLSMSGPHSNHKLARSRDQGKGKTAITKLIKFLSHGHWRLIRFKIHKTHPNFIPKYHSNKLLLRPSSFHCTHGRFRNGFRLRGDMIGKT